MRKSLGQIVAASVLGLLALTPAAAKTCSERPKVCQGFCVKSEGGSPACMSVCSGYLQSCLLTGCWESKYVDKQCGFTRR